MQAVEIVSKGQFAVLCNVTPGRVSQWLQEGHISGDALVGEGRNAKINASVARKQLQTRRHLGQSLGNGLKTDVRSSVAPAGAKVAAKTPPKLPAPRAEPNEAEPFRLTGDDLDEAIRQAKLWDLEAKNRETAEREAHRRGAYIETNAARREMTQIAEQVLRVFEGSLTEIAGAIHSQFGIENREILHLLHQEFRKVRLRAATASADKAAGVLKREAELVG